MSRNTRLVLARPRLCPCTRSLRIRRVDVDDELLSLFGVVDNFLQRGRELVEGIIAKL